MCRQRNATKPLLQLPNIADNTLSTSQQALTSWKTTTKRTKKSFPSTLLPQIPFHSIEKTKLHELYVYTYYTMVPLTLTQRHYITHEASRTTKRLRRRRIVGLVWLNCWWVIVG